MHLQRFGFVARIELGDGFAPVWQSDQARETELALREEARKRSQQRKRSGQTNAHQEKQKVSTAPLLWFIASTVKRQTDGESVKIQQAIQTR